MDLKAHCLKAGFLHLLLWLKKKSHCIEIALVSLQFQILFNEKQCLFSKL